MALQGAATESTRAKPCSSELLGLSPRPRERTEKRQRVAPPPPRPRPQRPASPPARHTQDPPAEKSPAHESIVIHARRKKSMKSGKTARTARSCSRRVPPRKLTAAAGVRGGVRGRGGASVRSRVLGLDDSLRTKVGRRATRARRPAKARRARPGARSRRREEHRRTPHAPRERRGADREADPEHLDKDGDERGEVEREDAVPEDAQRLEERAARTGRASESTAPSTKLSVPGGPGLRQRSGEQGTHTLPPRSLALSVTTTEPAQTMTKTPVKIGSDWSVGAAYTRMPNERERRGQSLPRGSRERSSSARTVGREEDGERQAELQGETPRQYAIL